MLREKTSSRIRQFISHGRSCSSGSSEINVVGDQYSHTKLSSCTSKRLSWLSQTPSAEISSNPRKACSVTTADTAPKENLTAHSSASSLCSCSCGAEVPIGLLSRSSPSGPSSEFLSREASLSDRNEDPGIWRLQFIDTLSGSDSSTLENSSLPTRAPTSSTINLMEALTMEPDDKTPTQSIMSQMREVEVKKAEVPEMVEQLCRETVQVFQAVGTALADAKAAALRLSNTTDATVNNFDVSRSLVRKRAASQLSMSGRSTLRSKLAMQRSASINKTKNRRFMKQNGSIFARKLSDLPPAPLNSPPRSTLTNVAKNIVDVFNGKMFRTEVDELLNSRTFRKMKAEQLNHDLRDSTDSSRSVSTGGSSSAATEPFHLEDLTRRIKQAQTSQQSKFPETRLKKFTERRSKFKFADLTIKTPATAKMIVGDLTFPSPPITPRRPSNCRGAPLLPTIPEVSPLYISMAGITGESQNPPPTINLASHAVLLPSPPLSLTPPSPHQFPIHFNLVAREPMRKPPSPEEEAQYSRAFQEPVSGADTLEDAGISILDERQNEWEDDEAELDSVLEWWASFGFGGHGSLVTESTDEDLTVIDQQNEQHRKYRTRLKESKSKKSLSRLSKSSANNSSGRDRPNSLPPGSLLDVRCLRVGGDEDVIPLGFIGNTF